MKAFELAQKYYPDLWSIERSVTFLHVQKSHLKIHFYWFSLPSFWEGNQQRIWMNTF